MEITLVRLLRTTFDRTVTLLEELTGEPRWVGYYDILIKIRMSRGSIACDVVGLPPHLNLGYEIDFDRGHQDALHSILGFETGIEKFSVVVDVLGKYKPMTTGLATIRSPALSEASGIRLSSLSCSETSRCP